NAAQLFPPAPALNSLIEILNPNYTDSQSIQIFPTFGIPNTNGNEIFNPNYNVGFQILGFSISGRAPSDPNSLVSTLPINYVLLGFCAAGPPPGNLFGDIGRCDLGDPLPLGTGAGTAGGRMAWAMKNAPQYMNYYIYAAFDTTDRFGNYWQLY